MKRTHFLLTSWFLSVAMIPFALFLSLSGTTPAAAGELAKEGTFTVNYAHAGSCKNVSIGEGKWAWSCNGRISALNAAGEDVLNNMSGDCVHMGAGENSTGYCSFVDNAENQIFEQWEGGQDKGIGKLVGGTGKFKGITGELKWTWTELPAPDGHYQGVGQKMGSYTLP